MQDSEYVTNINGSRLDDLIETLAQARNSLNQWQDRKTEALIRLDAFQYDIRMIEEEKKRMEEKTFELRKELDAQARIYQSHVGELTDQMQLLKLENENLRNEILDKNLAIESHLKEIENQKLIRDQWVKQQAARENEIRGDLELKAAQKEWELQMKYEGALAQIGDIHQRKEEELHRAERLEKELSQIRSHMLNVLKTEENTAKMKPIEIPAMPANFGRPASREAVDSKRELTLKELNDLRTKGSDEPTSVEEYLKRLGY